MKGWRNFLLASGLMFLVLVNGGQAQEKYPNRPIELVVPMSPGGSSDVLARIISEELARALNVQINVVNRPGGSGIQAATYVAKAKKDGYTLFEGTATSLGIMPVISKEATYDPLKDFIPLAHFGSVPSVIGVRSDSPFQTLDELMAYARKNPGKLRNACVGFGEVSYLNLEILCRKNQLKIISIPFQGGGESLAAFLGGHVDIFSTTVQTLGDQIKAGKARGLTVTSQKRYGDFPNIPTTAELGYPYVNLLVWLGVFAPTGVPQQVTNVLVPVLEKVFKNPDVGKRAEKAGYTVEYMGPEEFRKFVESQIQSIEKVAQDINLIKK